MRMLIILLGSIAVFVFLSRWAMPGATDGASAREAKLLDALYTRQTAGLEALLASGAAANAVDPESSDPVLAIATQMRYREAFELLLRHGADVNGRTRRGETPLLCAIIGGSDGNLVERLIETGADVNAPSGNGMTALMVAAMADDAQTMERLLRAGARIDARNDWGKSALDLAQSPRCRAGLQAAASEQARSTACEEAETLPCDLSRRVSGSRSYD